MRLATAICRAQLGLASPEVSVEVHISGGIPSLVLVGMVETAVRESRDRVRAAIQQAGLEFPYGRIAVNLAPADLPKAGSRFDLAIAVAILAAAGQLPTHRLEGHEFYGELALSGKLRPVPGLLPSLMAARTAGRTALVPAAAAREAGLLGPKGIGLAGDLGAVLRYLRNGEVLPAPSLARPACGEEYAAEGGEDLADVQGQAGPRRALEIAAAGAHHLLFAGPPGTGKTLLARRLPGLLPPLAEEEALEVAAINSLVSVSGAYGRRPFRTPHHSASVPALVGGGGQPRPGEISLAHRGVLFLDELPEFARPVLEALREPLSTGRITIARARCTVDFPADFQLLAAMNPCPCGYYGDPDRPCRCSPDTVRRYQARVSGPLLDRMDMVVLVGRRQAGSGRGECSAAVRARVSEAARRQLKRQGVRNGRLENRELARSCPLDEPCDRLLSAAAERFGLSARAVQAVRRVARTIADLDGRDRIATGHLAEALGYRAGRAAIGEAQASLQVDSSSM